MAEEVIQESRDNVSTISMKTVKQLLIVFLTGIAIVLVAPKFAMKPKQHTTEDPLFQPF